MSPSGLTVFCDPRFRDYDFGPDHPFSEASRSLAASLLEGSLPPQRRAAVSWQREVEPATAEVLRTFHEARYLDRLRAVSTSGSRVPLDGGDTPAFPGCYEASARIVAGTERAVRLVLDQPGTAFVPAGGLHHARPDGASGFCILNDVAVGVAAALDAGRRVAYVDIDAHHGDGVMYGFYRSGRLLDIDFHQDGRTLFPGTGHVRETGEGDGAGLKVNLPLPPGTGDEALVPLAQRFLPPLLREYRPELIVLQHGVDGHWGDPLTQLQYTPTGYAAVDRLVVALAREFGGRLVVTGGGGYRAANVARTLARAGILLAGELLPAEGAPIPESWRNEFFEAVGTPAPAVWVDPPRPARSLWGRGSEERLVRDVEQALGRRFPTP
jgi:acetoin utilization protein AcuC